MPQQLDDLIFDRTQSDVSRVQSLTQKMIAGTATDAEREEWLGGMKGAYNAADLNRVGEAVEYLSDTLQALGYSVETSPKTDWTEADIPTQLQMKTYLENIRKLRDKLPYAAPDAPTDMTGFSYQEANNVEEILYALERVLLAMQENFLLRQANTPFMIAGGSFNEG